MARRGLATALQAALAGFGGYGQGVIAQRERQQKLSQAEEERKRREMLDILDVQERGYMRPEQLVQARQEAAAPTSRVAQSAILSALSPTRPAPLPSTADIATVMETAALRQPLAGQQRITVGGQEYVRPEAPTLTERRELSMERAQKMFDTAAERRTRQEELEYQRKRDKAADELALKRYGLEVQRLGLERERQRLALGTGGAPGAPGGRRTGAGRAEQISTLPTVTNVSESLKKLTDKDVKALSGMGVAAAAKVPMLLTSSRGGFADIVSLPAAAGFSMLSDENDKAYAENVRAVGDAVASMVTAGVMTDQDIGRFQAQVLFNPNESDEGKLRKFNNLKLWAAWLESGGEGKYPGESDQSYLQRASMMRRGGSTGGMMQGAAGADTRTPMQKQWDKAVQEEGLDEVLRQFGPRP